LSFKAFPSDESPVELFSKLYERSEYSFILESMEGPRGLADYTFLGYEPRWIFRAGHEEATIEDRSTGEIICEKVEDPFQMLRNFLIRKRIYGDGVRFSGGAVGYISYDAIRHWEEIPEKNPNDLRFPDIEMAIYEDFILFDRYRKHAFYCFINEDRSDEFLEATKGPAEFGGRLSFSTPHANISEGGFKSMVIKAKEYIASGDIFQVVLSRRFESQLSENLIDFYRSLRRINPSPYMYFLKMGDRSVIGSSPEMLMKVEGNSVETFPIAGTRPRGRDPKEDRRLAKELLEDPKERAEHIMLVDLSRNDIGRISKFGSVKVREFMSMHKYSHVQHIVSRVVGELENSRDSFDALKALFPAGTVSGAPKIRAMEIIEELEPTRRGPYAGAVGYFSYNGNADFAITIRTLLVEANRGYIQAGAGIVADSDPEKELFETEHKASALLKALQT
jgi:anthranilate synthase component 1